MSKYIVFICSKKVFLDLPPQVSSVIVPPGIAQVNDTKAASPPTPAAGAPAPSKGKDKPKTPPTEAPTAETPKGEAPAAEAPTADAPAADAPAADAPAADAPGPDEKGKDADADEEKKSGAGQVAVGARVGVVVMGALVLGL